ELPDPGLTPDSHFYFLKSWKESIQLFFTFGEENKAKQFLHLADVRLAEYQKMIEKGKTEIAQKTLEKYEKQLNHALDKAEQVKEKGKDVEKLKDTISEKILKHQEVLENILEKVPEEAKKGIEKALDAVRNETKIKQEVGSEEEEIVPEQPQQQEQQGQQEQSYQMQQLQQQPQQPSDGSQQEEISVKTINSTYKIVSSTSKPSGWFQTGQDADLMLSGIDFNNTGGPLLFNHPGTIASDGTHLLLADRNNNRVLIWNKLPADNTPPDIVLGQKNFTSNNPGVGLDEMNWPVGVSVGGGKLVIADTNNNRILIWNSFPIRNGQPADLVINSVTGDKQALQANKKRSIQWPWGVWTDGKKLAMTSTINGLILLWNTFPTQNDQISDVYLTGRGDVGTPRTITSDGNHLIVGDHNAKVATSGQGNFFWKNWPASDDAPYDFFMVDPYDPRGVWMQGDFTQDGKLVMLGTKLHIWNSFPENASDQPDVSAGPFIGGDGSGAVTAGNRLYLSLSNDNKIVGFNSLPATPGAKPNFVIGSPGINTNTLDTNFIMSNPVPATDGKSLFISSDFDRKLYVWKNLPDESNAHPDFVYSLPDAPWDNELFGDTFALAGKQTVIIWKNLPKNGEKPDLMLQNSIGNVSFQDLQGVAMDSKYFYLSDNLAGKIYVWEDVPSANSNPKFTIDADSPGRLSSDGNYLVDAATMSNVSGGSIRIYKISDLSSKPNPTILGGPNKFNLPQGALISQGHLFVGDTGFSRVLIWKNIEDAIAGKNADVILGAEFLTDTNPEIGKNKLFWPANLTFDGSFLWVGEFKFSERLLRFSVKP
ncbi:MAG: DUF5667 domain-containing protein, partial [Candidatus Curtissbacteria bacterium]|nr:DUF5667 domain-containing protein [Candidatus Curtissbacteria bacterium]